jgi:ligand-binding sensor domain-containing protein
MKFNTWVMRQKLIKFIFLLIWFWLWNGVGGFAQQSLRFYNYTNKNGLSSNYIKSFAQDHLGYIWIATNDGLSRFDGLSFKHFRTTGEEGGDR